MSEALSRRGLLKGAGLGAAAAALPWPAMALESAPRIPLRELEGLLSRVGGSPWS